MLEQDFLVVLSEQEAEEGLGLGMEQVLEDMDLDQKQLNMVYLDLEVSWEQEVYQELEQD